MAQAGAIRAGRAFVELFADDSKLVRGLKRAQSHLKAFGTSVGAMGTKLMAVGATMLSPIGAGAKVFADFEKQMANVSTMLDNPDQWMPTYRTAIRDMAVEFGESTETLSSALYDILSASVEPAKALEFLRASVKSAKGGMSDAATSTKALLNVLNAFHVPAERVGEVSDMLFATIKRGVTTFPELADSIGSVTAVASSAGISFDELGASVATMTRNGLKTEMAVVALKGILAEFLKPSAEGAEAAAKLGFQMNTATLKSKGLVGVLEMLAKVDPETISRIFPDVRSLAGVLALRGDLKGFAADAAMMASKTGMAQTAFGKMTGGLAGYFSKAKQAVTQTLSVIGETFAPAIKAAFQGLLDGLKIVRQWIADNRQMVITIALVAGSILGLGVALKVVGVSLVVTGKLLGTFAVALALPAKLIIGLIALIKAVGLATIGLHAILLAAVGGILYFTGAGAKALGWMGERFDELASDARAAFGAISNALAAGDIGLAAKVLWLTLKMEWQKGVNFLTGIWVGFKSKFMSVIDSFVYGGQVVWVEFSSFIQSTWAKLVGFLKSVWAKFSAWHARTVETTANWIAKKWVWVEGKVGGRSDQDIAFMQQHIDQQSAQELQRIDTQEQTDLAAAEARKQDTLRAIEEGRQRRLVEIAQADTDSERQRSAEYAKQLGDSESSLAQAKKEWQDAIKAANAPRPAKKPDQGPPGSKPPAEDALQKAMESIQTQTLPKALGVKGSFNAAALLGLQAGGVEDRIAKATEQTAANTKKLAEEAARGGLAFG